MATRSQVYLGAQDGISSVVNNIARNVDNLNRSLANMGSGNTAQIGVLRQISSQIDGIGGSIGNVLLKFGAWATALIGIKNLGQGVFDLFEHGVKFNMDTQTATIGIAGLIASLETFRDASGKMVEGPQKFALATKAAQSDVQKLLLDALKTGANFQEVRDAYTQALAPGLSNGMNRDQIRQLSTLTANAAKSMGMEKGMVGQEIRALLSGKIDKNATIGSALGLGPVGPLHDAYEQALKTGKGYEFLQDKLKEFNTAGQAYASSLAGVFSQMGDVFDQFSGKAAEGLTKSLEKLSEPLTSLFDQNTGEWADSLQPILAVFNDIGETVGTSIVDGVNTVVEAVKEFGAYLDEDQTLINTMESAWSGISDVLSSIFGIVGTIFGVIGDIVGGIMNALGLTSQTGEELTGWQKAMLLVNGAAQGLAIIFAGLKDVITLIANFIRTALGGAVQAVAQILQGFILLVAKGLSAIGMQDASKTVEEFSKKVGAGADEASKKIAGMNNTFTNMAKGQNFSDAMSEAFKGTTDQLAKSAQAFEDGNKKANKSYQDWKDKLDKQKADRLKAQKDNNGGLPPGYSDKATYPSKEKAKKEKGSKGEDTQKLAYENELNDLKTALDKEKNEYSNQTKWLELDRQNNLINLQDYFSKKKELDDNDYQAQLKFIDESIALAEKQKANAKSVKDANKIDKDINKLTVERQKLEQDYAYNKHKNTLDQIKDLREYSNKLKDLDAQIDEMTGKTGESRTIKLNIEIENLKEQYKADPTALAKISQLENLKKLQLDYNNASEQFNLILDSQSIKEDAINQSQKAGRISELDALKKVGEERQKNINLLEQQIEKLDGVYNTTKDPALINQIDTLRNKLQSLKDEVDPIKEKFDTLFYDSMTSGLADFISGTKTASEAWKDFSNTIINEISKIISSQAISEIKNLFGLNSGQSNAGNSPGGIISSLFGSTSTSGGSSSGSMLGSFLSSAASWIGGFFASGGSITGDKPVVVGEGGPELFFPGGRGGYIMNTPASNSVLSGSSGNNIIQNITISTKDYHSFNNSSNQVGVQLAQALQKAGRDM